MKVTALKQLFHKELDGIYGTDEVESFFFLCTEFYLNLPRIELTLQPEFSVVKHEYDVFFNVLEALKQQKPIQYILGETEFFGLKLNVNENVLIPRQETEELVYWIIRSHTEPNKLSLSKSSQDQIKILDIGTGSGCIAISLAKNLPHSKVYALDISNEALSVAKRNADLNEVDIMFIETDILNDDSNFLFDEETKFDIIVSNPPYVRNLEKQDIKPNVLDNEPHLALFVEDTNALQFYKAITDFAFSKLKPKGQLYFEINQYLGDDTKQLLVRSNFENIELRQDISGNDRMLKGIKK